MKNVFFFMCLLLSLSSAVVQSCSSHCTCAGDLANCKFVSSLQEVLTDLPRTVTVILLQGGSLATIKPRMFQNFSKLWYLSITDFKLSPFNHVFTRSPNAQSSLDLLDLSSNKLESCSVESLAFAGLHNLTELKLNNNSLDTLKRLWFSGLTLLKKLHIQFNKISYLPPRTFEALIQLYHLNASSNLIQYISTGTFHGLGSLTDLDLSNNQLLFIDSNAFGPVKRLNLLYLNDNQLELLAKVPGSTQKLRLYSNHWECHCQLVLFLETCNKAIEDRGNLFCQSPEDVEGKPILNFGFSYCSSTTLLPLTTPLRSTTPALQIIPTISVLAIIYGFLGGFLLAVAISLITRWKYRTGGIPRSFMVRNRKQGGNKGMELDTNKLETVSTIASHLAVHELQNIEDNQEEQRQGYIHMSTELQRNVDRENINSKVMQPYKSVPSSHLAADISHLQNKGIDSTTGKNIRHGKAVSRGDAEKVVGKLCMIAQTDLSNNSYFRLCVSNQDKGQHQDQEVFLSETLRTGARNFAGNLRNINSEAHDPETEGEDSPNVSDLPVLCNEAISSQLEFKTGDQEKIEMMELQDIQTENLEKNEAIALYREENEILEDASPPGKVIELNETSVNDCTSEMNRKILLHATNPIGSKVRTRRVTIDEYSRIAAISMGGKILSSALFNGDGDAQLPDVEDIDKFAHSKCKKPENIPPVIQKFVAGISEHVHTGTSTSKNVALVDKAQTSDRDQVVLGGAVTKETVQSPESSVAPADGTIASGTVTEDEVSSVGSVSTSFGWPYTWSAQSPEHWSQSSTTLESTLGSNHSKANLSPNVTSKDDEPEQWESSIAARENNLDWEDDRSEAIPFQSVTRRNSAPINREPELEWERHFQSAAIAYSEKVV
ncbi:uncharacterized protein LOC125465272 [Stegostoma tigrinum]|uniref:uncharacterized protein LOC125465272 n=1 Tax=Stegostoma tigrinum TaxID=3053191 RepID=UPI00202B9AA3|nr:uncharacterized protein LOC125465272 [Stegostoma tigrinum]